MLRFLAQELLDELLNIRPITPNPRIPIEYFSTIFRSLREVVATLLENQLGIEAILAFNDLVAVGALQACQEAGKKVPEDVAIIGADDIPLAKLIRPQLSTSRDNLGHIGWFSMRTLLEMFAGETSRPPTRSNRSLSCVSQANRKLLFNNERHSREM